MDLRLSGRVALVTGASRGIGLAVVRSLAAEGACVVAGARTVGDDLIELGASHDVRAVAVDLTAPGGPERLVTEAVDAFGSLDVLVNNVGGVRPRLDGFLAVTDQDWAWALEVNLLTAVRTTRAALPHLLASDNASIVSISSVNAHLPDPSVIDYSAAKGALSNFCKSLSKEFGPQGVRVNTISPGPVETDLWLGDHGVAATVAKASDGHPEEVAKQAVAGTSTGRFTHPQEVADLVLLLASGRAGNVTGTDILIDGGLIKTL
jgi:NAD(P)-dependent dehydrogenase (short-subunit alcohol dehydrogenase family)